MSETSERDAVCQEFGAWYRGEIPEEVHWSSAEAMADEIVRQRAELADVRAAIARVRELHVGKAMYYPQWCYECNVVMPCPTLRALDGDA